MDSDILRSYIAEYLILTKLDFCGSLGCFLVFDAQMVGGTEFVRMAAVS